MAEKYYLFAEWFWCRLGGLVYPGLGKSHALRWRIACYLWARSAIASEQLLMIEHPELRPK